MDWKNLPFAYFPTKCYVKADYIDGQWSDLSCVYEPYVTMHIASTCLHYGQECFEGLKAFRTVDGRIVMFRPDENAMRMAASADRLCMAIPSEEMFINACEIVIRENIEFLPPYGTGASLYIRPLLIGIDPIIGVSPSKNYLFIVLVTPVGPYYKHGLFPVEAYVAEHFDRAAPRGTGHVKVGGNYAASLKALMMARERNYPMVLYSHPADHSLVNEFGTSNFFGITHDEIYKTPDSRTVLPSITNKSLRVIARDLGMDVVKEAIPFESLDQFAEVGACGTAAVITPIHAINYRGKNFYFGKADEPGPVCTMLYKQLQGIQHGEIEDTHHWLHQVE